MSDVDAAKIQGIGLILAAVGGFADAGSFVLIGGFTGHITGNSLLAAVYLIRGQFAQASLAAISVVAFMAGTAAAVVGKHEGMAPMARLRASLLVEIALIVAGLFLFAVGGVLGHALFATAVCLSLGAQNGTLDKLKSVSVRSTFITGMSTSLLKNLFNRKSKEASVLTRVIACFWVGALAGAFLVYRLGEPGYAFALALLAAALALTAPSRHRSEARA